MDTFYDVLRVPEDATEDEIKKAYRRLAKKVHPDTVAGFGDKVRIAAEVEFKKVNAARTVLMDPVQRMEYDDLIARTRERHATPEYSGALEEEVVWTSDEYDHEIRDVDARVAGLQAVMDEFYNELRDMRESTGAVFGRLDHASPAEKELRDRELAYRTRIMGRMREMASQLQEDLHRLDKVSENPGEFLDVDVGVVPPTQTKAPGPAPKPGPPPPPAPDDDDTPVARVRRRSHVRQPVGDKERLWIRYKDKILLEGICPFCDKEVEPDQTYCYYCGAVF